MVFKRRALRYLVEWFGDMPVGQVTPAMIEDYRALLAKGRSKGTANGYLSNLKPFFGWCRRHGWIEMDPFAEVRLFKVPQARLMKFDAAELERLVRVAIGNPYWLARIGFGLVGCRRGETFNLRREELRLDESPPHILLAAKDNPADGWSWATKTYRLRFIAAPPVILCGRESLRFHEAIAGCLAGGLPYVTIEPKYYERMMARRRDGTLSYTNISDPTGNWQRVFRRLQERAGIRPTQRYHSLRRTFGTAAVAQYGLAKATQALGNASAEVTRKHYNVNEELAVVAEMGRMAAESYVS